MSQMTSIQGYKKANKERLLMADVYNSCARAGIEIPEAVQEFFEYGTPDPVGEEVKIPSKNFVRDKEEVFEINVADIPPDVETIRFINSW
jgi:hypothetical protein